MRYTQPITLAPRGQDSLSFFLAPGGLTPEDNMPILELAAQARSPHDLEDA